jgi:hypothetical protein
MVNIKGNQRKEESDKKGICMKGSNDKEDKIKEK